VQELTELAVTNANPTLALQMRHPGQVPADAQAVTHFDDGYGQTYVIYEGRAIKKQELDAFLGKAGGYLNEDGQFVSPAEVERVQAKVDEIMGTRSPETH
jgi:hypothetical protein